ncbi:MAG: glycosyltransferase family 9 protein [Candidatus Paceibacterota bacterium]|jgi:ADP-heptose:LPS heptosyltransferase
MKVLSSNKPVFAQSSGVEICYCPYCRYIVSDYEAMCLHQMTPNTEWTMSSFNPYERRYGGQNLNGKKVAIYRHTAYGDILMISSVPYYLKTLYPDASIHLYCDPGMMDMWHLNPYVGGSAVPIPIPFDVARAYDYHIFYEGMLESNGEPDQNNCYDDFFGRIGFTNVPPMFKRPHIIVRPEDGRFVLDTGLDLTKPYLVYHLSPANKNRCYPVEQGMKFVKMVLDAFPDWRVLVVGKENDNSDPLRMYREHAPKSDRVVDLVNKTGSFRNLIPIIQRAKAVVCPDSSVLHLAACFPDVPTVSMWGIFHPDDRAKYYANHHPIFHGGGCALAPCHNHEFTLPLNMCTKADGWKGGSQFCHALLSITPEEILEKVKEVVR